MIDTLTSTPFFGLGVTLLCWYLAVRFQKRTARYQQSSRRQHHQTAAGSRHRRSGSEHLPAAGHSEAALLAGGAELLCG